MNKKKWTYVLIVIVTGLWSYNIYKTMQTFNASEVIEPLSQDNYQSFKNNKNVKDTFLLILPSDDPFLTNKFSHQAGLNRRNNESKSITSPTIPKRIVWPKIQYYGFVKNRTQDHQLCVLNIDNRIHKMSIGDSFKKLRILSATKDSLKVEFLDEIKFVRRAN